MSSPQQLSLVQALQLAVSRHQAGSLQEAEHLYRLILQVSPRHPDANHNLGVLMRDVGRDADALPFFAAAVASDPRFEQYALSHADALLACQRWTEAIEVIEQARQNGLDTPALKEALGRAKASHTTFNDTAALLSPDLTARIVTLFSQKNDSELESILDEVLQRHPQTGLFWKLQGVCLARQGKNAREAMERAVVLLPNDVEARRNLVRILHRASAWSEAWKHGHEACRLAPDSAEDHAQLADIARDLGRLSDAEALYRRALQLNSSLLDAHNNLGNTLFDLGRSVEAEACYRKALELDPGRAAAWCNLGLLLKSVGRDDEAQAACDKARAADPSLAGPLVLAGDLALDRGRFSEAEILFRQATACNPRSPEAWAGIARTRKLTTDDAPWARQAAALANSGLTPDLEVFLRYALGKYHDDTRQYDTAFGHYQRANELSKIAGQRIGKPAYDPAGHAADVDWLIAHFSTGGIARSRFSHVSACPVFIIGMPRSGTSLAEQILASHPDVFGAGELPFWHRAQTTYTRSARTGTEPQALLNDMATDCLRRLHSLAPQAARVVDKMPNNFLNVGLIHAAFPNARFIHMQRNPVDVCLSIYFNPFAQSQPYANDLEHLAHYTRQYQRLMQHWRTVLPQGCLLDLPYEALVDDQEAWSRKMIEFIGLPWDERCLQFHTKERAVHTPSNWQVRQRISKGSVERWRNYEKFVEPLITLLD